MKSELPGAVPEIPVADVDQAAEYYVNRLGFSLDWGGEAGGIAGISNGQCRMFLTNGAFRQHYGNTVPVLIWLNLDSNEDVDQLHERWQANQVKVVSPPESKPWGLREFTVTDLDGNLLRIFHDFGTAARADAR